MKKNKIKYNIIYINKSITFNYKIQYTIECGISLLGYEVKSIKLKHLNINSSYAMIIKSELFLIGLQINSSKFLVNNIQHKNRIKKLLLHKNEIKKLKILLNQKKLSIIPIQIYLKNNKIKVLIGIMNKKKLINKKQIINRKYNIDISEIKKKYFY